MVEVTSMFKTSIDYLAPLFKPEQIYVVAGQKYFNTLREHAPEIPAENFIIEPYGRDSGPAAALSITVIPVDIGWNDVGNWTSSATASKEANQTESS
jgi:mannose-1-phosphate guanylyltransferase